MGSPSKLNSIDLENSLKATESNRNRSQITKHMKDLSDKNPTMVQKLAILETWFVSKAGNLNSVLSIRDVGELIEAKGLANDIDSAIKIVI